MNSASLMAPAVRDPSIPKEAQELAPWFHNLHLPDGSQTAPQHPLGDFPANKWQSIAGHLPNDLTGWTALDIGCNAGFYSLELARRGAQVAAVDCDPHFLDQARWAVARFKLEERIHFHQLQVYDLARVRQQFDIVLFLGVFYHLRYPALALDIVAEKARRLLLLQTLTVPGKKVYRTSDDYGIGERGKMLKAGWPRMAFIEKSLAGDATNWWAPNHACVEALLRSTGMRSIRRIAHEIYFCVPPENGLASARKWNAEERLAATGRNGGPDGIPGLLLPAAPARSQPSPAPAASHSAIATTPSPSRPFDSERQQP